MAELRSRTLTRPSGAWAPLLDAPPAWADRAACTPMDADLFYAPHGERTDSDARRDREDAAKSICAACPVRAECLTYALETRQHEGIWGGTTEIERRAIARALRKDPT